MTSFVDHFRDLAEAFLTRHPRISHSWSSAGDFLFLEIHNYDPLGFAVRANVSSWYALVIADGSVSYKWEPKSREDVQSAAAEFVNVLVVLLTPSARLREVRRGNRTSQRILERLDGLEWRRLARQYSINPLSYFGQRCDVVRQNRLAKDLLDSRRDVAI